MTNLNPDSPIRRTQDIMARLTPVQKIALGAALLTLVAGGLLLTRVGSGPEMAPLYTDLAASDASSVVDELAGRGVEYELTDAGRTILVPRSDVYDLRIAMSAQGLPAGNEGYALLDRQGITTSEFRQRIDYQRALEGEIARTIRAMDGVLSATVHLVMPEESVFIDTPSNATASVMVSARGVNSLGDDQVDAIVHLVSSSVKNLAPNDVTVISSEGLILSAAGRVGGIGGGGTTAKAKAEAALEREMAASLTSMLMRVTGPGKVAVTVNAELDMSERQSTSESFANVPDGEEGSTGAVVAERTSNENFTGTGGGATGILGPDGAQIVPEVVGDANASEYQRDDAERSFALDRTVEQVVEASGRVERISVSVLLDEGAVAAGQVNEIQQMVAAAAGIDAARGDTVVITRLPFDTSAAALSEEAAHAEAEAAAEAERAEMIRTAIIGGIIFVALILAFISARRARKVVATPIDLGEILATRHGDLLPLPPGEHEDRLYAAVAAANAHDRELAGVKQPELEAAPATAGATPAATTVLPPISIQSFTDETMSEITALAEEHPDEVASILRTWLSETPNQRR